MGKILCFDWLLERVCLVQSGFPALFPQEVVFWSLIIKPLLTKRDIKVAGSWPCFTYTINFRWAYTTLYYRKSFAYNGAKVWNALPDEIKCERSIGAFKDRLDFPCLSIEVKFFTAT